MTTSISRTQYSIKLFARDYTLSAQSVLILIVIAAIALRLLSAFFQGNTVTVLPGINDQVSYDSLADVSQRTWFFFLRKPLPMTRAGEPTAHWSFLYTLYLAILYALFTPQPLIARLLQAILVGGLQTYIIYLIGEKTFSKNVGLIAAAITAFYIYFIYYGGSLMTEPFYITAILYSLFLAMRISESTTRKQEIKLGIALGIVLTITILLRQVFLLFIPFLFLWIWIARFKRGRSLPFVSTIISLGPRCSLCPSILALQSISFRAICSS